jgi:glycine cleavage system H protein
MSRIPQHLKYTKTHEWLLEDNQTEATLGITDHAQQLLGDLVFIELPKIGQTVTAGDTLGVLESVKAASDYYAPISGVVSAINQTVVEHPEILNTDPYGQGWLVKLSPTKTAAHDRLQSADQYAEAIAGDH